jgi:uncharacterized protein YdbL (DUF1318 family)
MKRTPVFILIFSVFAIILSTNNGLSQDIKERMKDRLPLIVELKKKGIVGESVLNEENNDRMKVYEAIAKQQGGTADLVGKRRAVQIAEKAETGEWLQNEQGAWYQKR